MLLLAGIPGNRQAVLSAEKKAEDAKETAIAIGAVVAAAVVLGVFLFGRSRGRKKTTIVEVRRF